MFFVLIGIVILFVSFIIALFSLIREQNEREEPSYPTGASEDQGGSVLVRQDVQSEPVFANGDNQDVSQQASTEGSFSTDEEIINEVAIGIQGRAVLSGEISISALRQKD